MALIAASLEQPAPTPEDDATGALGLTRRDRLVGVALLAAAIAVVVALIATFWRPGPPSRVLMSTGAPDGFHLGHPPAPPSVCCLARGDGRR